MAINPGANIPYNPFAGGLLQAYENDAAGNLSELDTKGQSGVNLLGTNYVIDSSGQARKPLLVNLLNETSLRGLKPEEDGSGRDSRPYIYTPLPENATPLEKLAIDAAKFSYDFPIRGGALSIANSAKDFLRIGKFLLDAPKGPLFITKQVLLQLSNPKIETGQNLGIENTRIYNLGLNTLAQVPVNAFGVHLDRSGLLPVIEDKNKYFSIVKEKRASRNRLVLLHKSKIYPDKPGNGDSFIATTGLRDIGISPDYNTIIDYWGGPDSVLGILGRTTIKRAVNTNFEFINNTLRSVSPERGTEEPYYPYYSFLNSTYQTLQDNSKGKIKEDFRAIINREVAGGKKVRPESKYIGGNAKTVETKGSIINNSPLIRLDNEGEFNEITSGQTSYSDQIKFAFETLDIVNPSKPVVMLFKAFLDNFSDNHSADWQSFRYTGRGENFYTYNSYNRSINFGFKIAALKREEMKPLYQKLNYLASNLAPVYDSIFMSGPIVKITIGDYLYRQPGFFTSLNLSIETDSSWEINLEEDPNMYQLPQVINVDASFTPIHTFLVRRYESAPYITPAGSQNKWLNNPIVPFEAAVPIEQAPPKDPLSTFNSYFPNDSGVSPFDEPGFAGEPGVDTVPNPFNNFG